MVGTLLSQWPLICVILVKSFLIWGFGFFSCKTGSWNEIISVLPAAFRTEWLVLETRMSFIDPASDFSSTIQLNFSNGELQLEAIRAVTERPCAPSCQSDTVGRNSGRRGKAPVWYSRGEMNPLWRASTECLESFTQLSCSEHRLSATSDLSGDHVSKQVRWSVSGCQTAKSTRRPELTPEVQSKRSVDSHSRGVSFSLTQNSLNLVIYFRRPEQTGTQK